ncbi:type IV pilus assembly protein PilM [Candidatus Nomurabacteria bacterium]|nr:type IV pilus assembly protein PilM [Candidatus Nomurabacteria bacterium]
MAKLPNHVGIDFGNHTVKAVELKDVDGESPTLVNFGSQPTPHGVINSSDTDHQRKLADALKEMYSASGIDNKKVVLAIPESAVFTRFLELPGIKDDELQSAVFYQAKEYLPMPFEDVRMSFIKIGFNKDKNAHRVLLVAAPKKIVDIYQNVSDMAGIEPVAIETESIAMGRAMYRATKETQLVMLDFGSETTDMSIMADGYLVFSQSISIGSDALTQAIVNQFNFEYVQAEEYKRNYGLNEDALEGKISQTLSPIMSSILTEVRRGVEFYKSKTLLPAPKKYVLSGDGALLPGLADYISSNLSISAEVANPWSGIKVPDKYAKVIQKSKPSFAVSIGLALKADI